MIIITAAGHQVTATLTLRLPAATWGRFIPRFVWEPLIWGEWWTERFGVIYFPILIGERKSAMNLPNHRTLSPVCWKKKRGVYGIHLQSLEWKMMFLFNWVIFRWTMLNLRGTPVYLDVGRDPIFGSSVKSQIWSFEESSYDLRDVSARCLKYM